MNKVPDYFDKASLLMMTYQLIEESLRSILGRMDIYIWTKVQEDFHYDVDAKIDSYTNHAMGRLISLFKVYEPDKDFIKHLNKIKEKRDKVAHRCFLIDAQDLQSENSSEEPKASELIKDLEDSNIEAKKIVQELLIRYTKINQKLSEQSADSVNCGKRPPLSLRPHEDQPPR